VRGPCKQSLGGERKRPSGPLPLLLFPFPALLRHEMTTTRGYYLWVRTTSTHSPRARVRPESRERIEAPLPEAVSAHGRHAHCVDLARLGRDRRDAPNRSAPLVVGVRYGWVTPVLGVASNPGLEDSSPRRIRGPARVDSSGLGTDPTGRVVGGVARGTTRQIASETISNALEGGMDGAVTWGAKRFE
jgi:hypothetical protein